MSLSSFETMDVRCCDGAPGAGGSPAWFQHIRSLQAGGGLRWSWEQLPAGRGPAGVVRGIELICEGEGDARI